MDDEPSLRAKHPFFQTVSPAENVRPGEDAPRMVNGKVLYNEPKAAIDCNAICIFKGKVEGKRPTGKPRNRWDAEDKEISSENRRRGRWLQCRKLNIFGV